MACETQWQGVLDAQQTVEATRAQLDADKAAYDEAVIARQEAEAAEASAQEQVVASGQAHDASVSGLDAAYTAYRDCQTPAPAQARAKVRRTCS